jgi:HK97 family phage major capsid protein
MNLDEVTQEIKSFIGRHEKKYSELEQRIDQMDVRNSKPPVGGSGESLAQKVWDSAEFGTFKRNGRGRAIITVPDLSLKTTITSATVGSATSGVLMPQRVGDVVTEARRRLRLRDLLTVYPTQANAVDFVKITAGMTKASPITAEGDLKPENGLSFSTQNEPVQTIATWIPASKQVIEDFTQLRATIDSALVFAVQAEEEQQILFGDGTPPALHSLTHQAQSFDLTILTASDGYEYVDIIEAAVSQIAADDEVPADFVVLHPDDWHKIRRTKESTGGYIFGPPSGGMPDQLWELQVVPTSVMTKGYFLVGSSSPQACALFERQGVTVELSTEHSDYFVRNLVAIRGESRVALVVFRPNSFVFGALTQSPA